MEAPLRQFAKVRRNSISLIVTKAMYFLLKQTIKQHAELAFLFTIYEVIFEITKHMAP